MDLKIKGLLISSYYKLSNILITIYAMHNKSNLRILFFKFLYHKINNRTLQLFLTNQTKRNEIN